MNTIDEGSSKVRTSGNQPEDGGSNPTPSLKRFRARLIPRSEIVKFVERWHYSGNVNGVNSEFCFAFADETGKMVCAMILGQPAARSVGKYGKKVIEIRRLCCEDCTPKNTESRFIGYVLRWLAQNTKYDAVLAYSDLEHGHEGGIYAASNFKKVGRIPGAPLIEWGGKKYHDRSLRCKDDHGKYKPFALRLQAAVKAKKATVIRTAGKVVWVYKWGEDE
jgi:hypothetical protein